MGIEKKLRREETKRDRASDEKELAAAKIRSQMCMAEIMDVCKKYDCQLEISQGITAIPMRIEPKGENASSEEEASEVQS